MRNALLCVLLAACIGFPPGCSKKEAPKAAEEEKPDKPSVSQEEIDRDKARERAMQRKMEAEAEAAEKEMKAMQAGQNKQEQAAIKKMEAMAKDAEKAGNETEKAIKSTKPKKNTKANK